MTATRAVDVSIVIVSWNTREHLRRCLETLEANLSAATCETIVVDNNSGDGSAEMVRKEFLWCSVIHNDRNLGFAAANNQAIQHTRGRTVLLLNPDTEMRPGSLAALLQFLDQQQDAAAAGARLVGGDGSLQVSFHPAPTLVLEFWRMFHLDRILPLGSYPVARWGLAQPRRVDVLQGACLLLRREALDQVGLLDEGYFMYSEEMDLCQRLRRAGWRLYWVPQAEVVHHGGQSSKLAPVEMFIHLYRSKVLYFRKHHGTWRARFYKLVLAAAAAARLVFAPLMVAAPRPQRVQSLELARRYAKLMTVLPRL